MILTTILSVMLGMSLLGLILQTRKANRLGREVERGPKSIGGEVPTAFTDGKHRLERVFHDLKIKKPDSEHWLSYPGWHYKCTCGVYAPSVDNEGVDPYQGTEPGAIKAFARHKRMYAELAESGENQVLVAVNKQKEAEKALEAYKETCLCKELTA